MAVLKGIRFSVLWNMQIETHFKWLFMEIC